MTDPNLQPRFPVHLVLDNVRSAYNVGSAFRTADAAGIQHIHLCGMSAHPPHAKVHKTALGAEEWVPWTYYERTRDCLVRLADEGIARVAIERSEHAVPMRQFVWPRPVAVVFGHEVTGIHDKTLDRCDEVVHIPMYGQKNSLNVATVIGIVLYDVVDKWSEAPTG
jgi:tRNA G18 (ribose-2'-O)-methylase SpoU